MKLTVIIVSYNVRYYLEQCLRSVLKAAQGMAYEVYVVDNHSQDDSVGYIRSRFPEVHLVESNHNLGFARANNIAIRQSKGEYVLLLNPDTFVGENTIRRALEFMDLHPEAGGAGVQMHNYDGGRARESRRGLPTPLVSFKKMLGFSHQYYMSHLSWDEPAQIDVISGAFCLLRRKALEKVGLLDETFFMYGEDIDLSYRLLKGGWQNWYLPFHILHYKGESTQKSSFRYVHVFYQAMLIFFRKHYGHLSLLITLPIKLAIYLRALLALVHMLYTRMRRSLGFFDIQNAEPEYLFLGSQKMLDECRLIANRKGLKASYALQMPQESFSATCIVYDTTVYSYENILQMALIRPWAIGTYYSQSGVIITHNEIIR